MLRIESKVRAVFGDAGTRRAMRCGLVVGCLGLSFVISLCYAFGLAF